MWSPPTNERKVKEENRKKKVPKEGSFFLLSSFQNFFSKIELLFCGSHVEENSGINGAPTKTQAKLGIRRSLRATR